MKKMMMMVAIIALAGIAQAGSVRWSSGAFAVTWKSTGLTTTTIGKEYYLVLASDQATIASAINAGTFSIATSGVLGMGTASSTKGVVAAKVETSASLLTLGTSYNLAVLVFDSLSGTDYYQFSTAIPQTAWDGSVSYPDVGANAAFGAVNFNTANWTAVVPEPTSMALLALGVAAVGLRRRFRK